MNTVSSPTMKEIGGRRIGGGQNTTMTPTVPWKTLEEAMRDMRKCRENWVIILSVLQKGLGRFMISMGEYNENLVMHQLEIWQ